MGYRVPGEEPGWGHSTFLSESVLRASRNNTGWTLSKCLPFFAQMGEILGAYYAESFDRFRAAQGSDPDNGFLRCARIFTQRLGLLGPPAGDKPHLGDRRCLGERVQGHA